MNKNFLSSLAMIAVSFACGFYSQPHAQDTSEQSASETPSSRKSATLSHRVKTDPELIDLFENVQSLLLTGRTVKNTGERSPSSTEERDFEQLSPSKFSLKVDCNSIDDEALCVSAMDKIFHTRNDIAVPVLRTLCRENLSTDACSAVAHGTGEEDDRLAVAATFFEVCKRGENSEMNSKCTVAAQDYEFQKRFDLAIRVWEYSCRRGDNFACVNYAGLAEDLNEPSFERQSVLKAFCESDGEPGSLFAFCKAYAPYDQDRWDYALSLDSGQSTTNSAGQVERLSFGMLLFER